MNNIPLFIFFIALLSGEILITMYRRDWRKNHDPLYQQEKRKNLHGRHR